MKNFLFTLCLTLVLGVAISSCDKDDDNKNYVQSIAGSWSGVNASTGYTLVAEFMPNAINGGLPCTFTLTKATDEVVGEYVGTYTYNKKTGKAVITLPDGAPAITVYSTKSNTLVATIGEVSYTLTQLYE